MLDAIRRWFKKDERPREEIPEEADPRGGFQDEEYRKADPRDLVEGEHGTMAAPGGAPQEGETPEERRQRDRS